MEVRPIGPLAEPRFRPAPLMDWRVYPTIMRTGLAG
jgi:hypothetical protein